MIRGLKVPKKWEQIAIINRAFARKKNTNTVY